MSTNPTMARIEASWRAALSDELAAPSMQQLHGLLDDERRAGHEVYPSGEWIFAAFDHTPLERVRVVIVGQDPYHGPGQATGLAFGVPPGVAVPPSLRNVFTELADDLGIERPAHGDLTAWADRGVLLLNTSLTVRAGAAGSHSGRGWEQLTDAALRVLAERRDGIAFLLWGRHAQVKQSMVDPARHLVLTAAHPSPLSASRGFFGCRHFSRVNEYLGSRGQHPIDWTLPV